eukprot:TRINITY_DN13247_c0_g1_i2.p1 TRINITY_DN13247_c0_g1~~TRINITY_DN13247_c0_g1_i2.p1  ORF type:complete len:164 (+),score=37.19 TRINITY_DN13247_c0_g1_i2:268-759(+)
MFSYDIKPDLHICNLVLETYFNSNDKEKVKTFYESIKKTGPQPDQTFFWYVLQTFQQEKETAQRYYNEMLEMGIKPNTSNINQMLRILRNGRDKEQAKKLYEYALKEEIPVNTVTFNVLIKLFLDDVDMLQFYLDEMSKHGISSDGVDDLLRSQKWIKWRMRE